MFGQQLGAPAPAGAAVVVIGQHQRHVARRQGLVARRCRRCRAMPIWCRLLPHAVLRAASRAAWTAGSSSAISTPMMAMTTSSSTSVKPRTVDDGADETCGLALRRRVQIDAASVGARPWGQSDGKRLKEPAADGRDATLQGRGAAGACQIHFPGRVRAAGLPVDSHKIAGDLGLRRDCCTAQASTAEPVACKLVTRSAAPGGRRSGSPMRSDEVAAGEGAFSTLTTRSDSSIRKSSTIEPSRARAWARTPAGAGSRCSARISGTSRCERADERPLAHAAPHFAGARPPVFGGQPQEAGVA